MPRIWIAARLSSGLVLGITPVKYSNKTWNTPFPISLDATNSEISFSRDVSSPSVAPEIHSCHGKIALDVMAQKVLPNEVFLKI